MSDSAIRIALVDDDDSVRKALERLLSASHFEVEVYGSAREFLKSLKDGLPQCLVVDLHMQDLTGLDLQHRLRFAGIRIPTIVITAYSEPGIRERCHSAGAADFLLKPLNGTKLIGSIHSAIALHHE